MRRKQTSIRFSRSALPHRYLRYISWKSWKGISPLQAGFLPVLHPVSHPVRPPTTKSRIQLRSCYCCRHPEEKENIYWSFPEKKKNVCLPFFPHSSHTTLLSCCYVCGLSQCRPRPIRGRSIARRPRRFLRPSHKQKNAGPRHCAANPLATFVKRAQKNVDFSLKKTHVGTPGLHALASAARTYSLTARTTLFPFSFFTRKRKKKTEANSAGSNTSLGLTSFVLTMYAIGPSRLVR